MRIASGATNAYLHFVAFSTSDHLTRVTGLTSFNVYIAASSASTGSTMGVTVGEVNSTQMPGVYRLQLADSSAVTVGSGFDSREICIHITSSMDPVTRTFECYRPTVTTGQTLALNTSGKIADVESILSKVTSIESNTTGIVTKVTSIDTDIDTALTRLSSLGTHVDTLVSKVTSIDTDIDTAITNIAAVKAETTAIKAKTDSLNFTQSGIVNANIHYVNNVQVQGVGSTTDTWRPV